jgi:LPS O-antigen subunit length determinant protein (WzzB/FepE family)
LKNTGSLEFSISGEIFIAETKELLIELKKSFENSTGKFYRYGMFKDVSGYYKGFDFIENKHIYCASLKQKDALELVKKYINKVSDDV